MDFTGERFTTDCVREIWYEHWHRYAFAAELVTGKSVLDLACGEGYGSHLLAAHATKVIGIDRSQEAVEHAAEKYQRPNLSYQQGDASAIPLADDSIDIVVSFETLEHLAPQREMLAEFRRVLKPAGQLIISTPDKRTYSDQTDFINEYHVKELYREEFETLLAEQFPAFRLFGQKLLFQSVVWEVGDQPLGQRSGQPPGQRSGHSPDPSVSAATLADDGLSAGLNYAPVYLIAIAAADHSLLPVAPTLHLFGDQAESVYHHYNHEIRKNIEAGTILAERDAELAQLRGSAPTTSLWTRWFGGQKK